MARAYVRCDMYSTRTSTIDSWNIDFDNNTTNSIPTNRVCMLCQITDAWFNTTSTIEIPVQLQLQQSVIDTSCQWLYSVAVKISGSLSDNGTWHTNSSGGDIGVTVATHSSCANASQAQWSPYIWHTVKPLSVGSLSLMDAHHPSILMNDACMNAALPPHCYVNAQAMLDLSYGDATLYLAIGIAPHIISP
jgi:hypothetical protein